MLENGAQAQRREKSESPNNQNCGNKQNGEERAGHRKSAQRSGRGFLSSEIPSDCENGNDDKESSEQHGEGGAGVVPERVRVDTAKRRTVVAYGGSVSVD